MTTSSPTGIEVLSAARFDNCVTNGNLYTYMYTYIYIYIYVYIHLHIHTYVVYIYRKSEKARERERPGEREKESEREKAHHQPPRDWTTQCYSTWYSCHEQELYHEWDWVAIVHDTFHGRGDWGLHIYGCNIVSFLSSADRVDTRATNENCVTNATWVKSTQSYRTPARSPVLRLDLIFILTHEYTNY